jgi:choice-of-anchor A domain-containing protein
MKLPGRFRHLLGAALALAAARAVHASSVVSDVAAFSSDTRNDNLVALGNVVLNGSSDTQGGIAVQGNLTFGGSWGIGNNTSDDPNPTLYLNSTGTLNLGGNTVTLNNGYASIASATSAHGWNWNSPNPKDLTATGAAGSGTLDVNSNDALASTDPDLNAGPANWSWSTEDSNLDSISSDLTSATTNGTISVDAGGNMVLSTSATKGIVVFDLDASQLSQGQFADLKNIQLDVPTGMNYVINVLNLCDNQDLFQNVNFNSGTNDDQLLWNFSGASAVTVQLGGNFYGSILAPTINITDNTTINGTVVADNFTDNGVELHDTDDFVDLNVPEPRTFALWAVGLCGAMVLVGRRLRRPAKLAV